MYANPDSLVSTQWLAEHMSAPDVRLVDATWFLPGSDRDPRAEYVACHIPGAVFFDIDEIADLDNPLPHMLPSPEKFSSRVRKLGLGDGIRMVIYDSNGGYMAAHRVWWTFRTFGHEGVSVLDGGLPKWLDEGRDVEDLPPIPRERHFTAKQNNFLVRSRNQVFANLDSKREQVVDARSPGRFSGADAEPRPDLSSGHIPGSFNVPFNAVVDMQNFGALRSADDIRSAFEGAGVDVNKPIVTTCGSGVTASVLAFALHLIGAPDVAVYDGSWTEWASDAANPVETG
jgi:thiosulfate/3-mercaptopyruvate sulfurtransferase